MPLKADAKEIELFTVDPAEESVQGETLDMVREEASMGAGSASIIIKESRITIGNHTLMYIPCSEAAINIDFPDSSLVLPIDPDEYDVYIMHVPYTLHQLSGKKYYDNFMFICRLEEQKMIAIELFPNNITKQIEGEWKVKVGPKLTLKNAGLDIGEIVYSLPFKKLMPVITTFGIGENTFYWVHEAPDEKHLNKGSHHKAFLMKVPHGSSNASIVINCKADISRKVGLFWKRNPIHIEKPKIIYMDFVEAKALYQKVSGKDPKKNIW